MTQRELAARIGKSASLVNQVINRTTEPSVGLAILLGEETKPHITAEQWFAARPTTMKRLWERYKRSQKIQKIHETSKKKSGRNSSATA